MVYKYLQMISCAFEENPLGYSRKPLYPFAKKSTISKHWVKGTAESSYTLQGLSSVPFTQCLEIVDFLAKGYKGNAYKSLICKE